MIYILCGSLILVIGILFFISPAKKPSRIYGYNSYLANQTPESFAYAQKVSRLTNVIVGLIQIGLGFLINIFNLNNFFLIWLITTPLFILPFFMVTEEKLRTFLKERDQLPPGYLKPDDRPKKPRTRGFKDM